MTLKTAITFTLTLSTCLLFWGCGTKTKNVDSCGDGFGIGHLAHVTRRQLE